MDELRELGDYALIKRIGQGALGPVYLAEHRFMKKQFAIKVLPEDLSADRGFIHRFEEEVGLLTALQHPHIVRIHNISYDQGRYFLVTDCIVDDVGETTNFAQYLLQKRAAGLTEDEVFRLLAQLADALDYAHSINGENYGIAHRGIKLNNILVSRGDSGVNLYLSDFGLSKIVGTGTFLTRTFSMIAETLGVKSAPSKVETADLSPLHNSFLQSYNFLAPEQKSLEKAALVGPAADVYSFGILAYYLLMNEYPEGYFDLPSDKFPECRYQWDRLIKECLRSSPRNRPLQLRQSLEAVKRKRESMQAHPTAEALTLKADPAMEALAGTRAAQREEAHLRPVIRNTQIDRPRHDPDPGAVFNLDTSVKQYTPERKEEGSAQPIPTEMVVIEGGAFYRGSNDGNRDEMPRHQITIDSFAIDIHPVTNEQFVRFLQAMGGVKDSNHNDIIRLKDSRINYSKARFSIESGYLKHPVVGVTWYGAVAYAKWVGKRLPTEAEWEIAALGDLESELYPTGAEIEKSQANFFSSDTTAVMSYPPNSINLYDMAGNVYEWCQDWYGYNYYETSVQEPINPKGPLQGVYRVLRGGCWKSLREDLRCSRRHRNNPGTVNSTYGFRCAADVE